MMSRFANGCGKSLRRTVQIFKDKVVIDELIVDQTSAPVIIYQIMSHMGMVS